MPWTLDGSAWRRRLLAWLPRISGRIPWWPGWCGATGQGARSGRPKARLEACPASGLAGVEMMKVSPVPACRPVLTRTVAGPVAAWTGASARRHRDGLAGSEFRRFSCLVRGSEPCSTLSTSMVSESEHGEGTRLITAQRSADGSPTTGTWGTWTRLGSGTGTFCNRHCWQATHYRTTPMELMREQGTRRSCIADQSRHAALHMPAVPPPLPPHPTSRLPPDVPPTPADDSDDDVVHCLPLARKHCLVRRASSAPSRGI